MTLKKIWNILYYIIMATLIGYFVYAKGWFGSSVNSITPAQAHDMIASDSNVTLLDVRTPSEFASEHIENATLVPLDALEQNLNKIDKSKKVIVYCRSGNRSITASRILQDNGFVPLNVDDGIIGWKNSGYEVTK
jgi:rhodanese-related sulfurtransferase